MNRKLGRKKPERFVWSITFRNDKGEVRSLSCTDPLSILDDAICLDSSSIVLLRERKCAGEPPTIEEVQSIYRKTKR